MFTFGKMLLAIFSALNFIIKMSVFVFRVVVFLSSAANFSENLLRLENETKPLEKLRKQSSCPRDFKRTTVDRLFRQLNFEIDWCAFELVCI